MMRCVILTVTVLFLCVGPIGCSDEVEETRGELGIQAGRRPVPEGELRKPPGPPNPTLVAEQPAPESEDTDDEDTDQDPD